MTRAGYADVDYYGDYLPNGFITYLLEVRLTMLPPVAAQAATAPVTPTRPAYGATRRVRR